MELTQGLGKVETFFLNYFTTYRRFEEGVHKRERKCSRNRSCLALLLAGLYKRNIVSILINRVELRLRSHPRGTASYRLMEIGCAKEDRHKLV